MSVPPPARRGPSPGFVFSRLGSLLAILPLGVWTVFHLWNNLAAFRGAGPWEQAVTGHAHPVSAALTHVIVLLPLLLHTAWGVQRLASTRPNNLAYPFYDNVKYLLQRVAGVGVLLFLGAHIYQALLYPRLVEGRPEPFQDIAHEMHFNAPTLPVYLLGTLGVCYHLANGVQTFGMNWGWLGSARALRRFEPVVIALFLALLAMGWGALYALWSAGATV